MADSKISLLPAAATLTGTEEVPLVQSLGNVQATLATVLNLLASIGVTGLAVTDPGTSSNSQLSVSAVNNGNGANIKLTGNGGTTPSKYIRAEGGVLQILNSGYTAAILQLTDTGAMSVPSSIGVNGASPPAQTTGWGTPTGASVQANFSGSAAPLTTCSAAIAEILTILKANGMIGA